MSTSYGINIGHGYVKLVAINAEGAELPIVVFPSLVAKAQAQVAGALERVRICQVGGRHFWTGEDALLGTPLTQLAQSRLSDDAYIPALLRSALDRLGISGRATGAAVSGLPASWFATDEKAQLLGQRLRQVADFAPIRVIPEPLALVYSQLLDASGNACDSQLPRGKIGVIDLGHHTVDLAILHGLKVQPNSLETFDLGTAKPLGEVRSRLTAAFERELTLFETDQAVRAGALRVAGRDQQLPAGWDRPLLANGELIASRLVEAWGKGAELDAILLGGGGAELEQLTCLIQRRFPHAAVIPDAQLAVARGYARFARRLRGAR